ncbi:betaine/proline/choline family ABC transporter ATP-binding protein [Sinorhizobium meliloti]|uniref:ABC transporter ATP-binding protein n=1 Tax=Rhizobium meliloti TaxID=382 RepID=UPI0004105B83|nr:ABC transporter ATP-binding protein [Sinorhizobium meliloti]MDE3831792.1 ABC transporter ATP-binding protein [Sinorhizobium meliloti]MDE4579486.1 ABC transporter ATP-binding protein [Sinorhizobium meliloti]MDW9697557.1 betaine/proline/choline family ABC transporter ATP-binding protein [Sinorhizobium meliloti]MDW9710426.1 betaine/proline/choline family ABC transporter ATP-binding protein [Sinorhizobium meliloti]MDW9747521.1 betaine/proline/choline family ABC transporter ATP-binding protein [
MIQLENLTKHYGPAHDPLIAVDNVSLDLPTGEICVLLGPSGCGKTTTMKMINRLIQPTSGKVFINGKDTSTIDPIKLRRTIGYVIQQIGLFPNKTIEENICVVPDLLGWDRRKSRARAKELLELVGLQPDLFLKRYPKELSGGQQQRVGVLRALAADPPVMLMDEPFGAIDPINREAIQEEFLKMQREIRKTIIFVSHDLDEAVKMADKIAIFRSGRLEQYAAPDELLARPANSFIEDFLGSDRALKRLRLVSVRDAMETGFITVRSSDSVEHALERMRSSRSAAVFVLNADGAPQSLLSEQVAELRSGTVGDHAEPVKSAVSTTGDLRQAVSIMFAHDMPLLPCVDEGGRMAGVMSYRSIVHYLAHGAKA